MSGIGQQVEEIPLRRQGEIVERTQTAEIAEIERALREASGDGLFAPMRNAQEGVEEPDLTKDVERRRVHGVAAEVAQKVVVLLEHDDVDAGAREQESGDRSRGSAAGDATVSVQREGGAAKPVPLKFFCG